MLTAMELISSFKHWEEFTVYMQAKHNKTATLTSTLSCWDEKVSIITKSKSLQRLRNDRKKFSKTFQGCSQMKRFFLKAGPPPPWFGFLVIFDFFAPWYRRHREASSVKISLKNSKEKLVKCATEVARLHRVSIQSCTQKRPSPKVQSLSRNLI